MYVFKIFSNSIFLLLIFIVSSKACFSSSEKGEAITKAFNVQILKIISECDKIAIRFYFQFRGALLIAKSIVIVFSFKSLFFYFSNLKSGAGK